MTNDLFQIQSRSTIKILIYYEKKLIDIVTFAN